MSTETRSPEAGRKIRSVRGELDQRGFSRRLGLSQQAISNYEQGNIPGSWEVLRRLNQEFDVNLNWLIASRGPRDCEGGIVPALADNRPGGWPHGFLEQFAFYETDTLECVLTIYFLYLATEPADAKARLASDFQIIVAAAREKLDSEAASGDEREVIGAVYDALERDDRIRIVAAMIRMGEWLESIGKRKALPRARRLYLAALSLARVQGRPDDEVESARRIGRSYRKEGRWNEADLYFRVAMATFEEGGAREDGSAPKGIPSPPPVPAAARARTLMGYGHIAREQGDVAAARERYLAALVWALSSSEPRLRAEVYLDLACLSFRERDWNKSLEFVNSGRGFAEQAGDRPLLNRFHLDEALVLREQGQLETAETILRALLPQTESHGDLHSYALASLNLAEVLLDKGAPAEAEKLLRSSSPAAEAHGDPRNLALRKLLSARIETAKGEIAAAGALVLDCLRYTRDNGLTAEFEKAASFWTSSGAERTPAVAIAS